MSAKKNDKMMKVLSDVFSDEVIFHRDGLIVEVSPVPKNLREVLEMFDPTNMKKKGNKSFLSEVERDSDSFIFKVVVSEKRFKVSKNSNDSDQYTVDIVLYNKYNVVTKPFLRYNMGSHDDSKVTKKEKGAKKFFTLMESIVEKNKTATYKIASIGDGREYITTSWKHNLGKYFEQIGVTGKIEYYKNDNFYYEQEPKPLQAVRTSRKSIEKHEETMKELLLSPNFLKSAIVELIISPLSSELLDVYNDFDPEVMANNKSKQKIINTAREKLTEYACAVKIHRRPVKEKSLIYKRVVIDMFLWQWQKNSTPKPFLTYDCNTVDELDMDCLRKFFDTLQSISRRNVKNVKYQLFLDPPSDDAYDPKFTNFIANLKGYMEMSGLQQPIITKVTY